LHIHYVYSCWGLTKTEDFDEIPSVKERKIKNAEQCQRLCCELGEDCITYQFWGTEKKCVIGKEVRLGKERGSTPLWCEPQAPHKWNGRAKQTDEQEFIHSFTMKKSKFSKESESESESSLLSSSQQLQNKPPQKCLWGDELPYQCWDFGDERLNSTGGRMNARECAAACCKTKNCIAWQELPGRGCFYNSQQLDQLDCDKSIETYHGRRKRTPSLVR
jgi:hypothetical protein